MSTFAKIQIAIITVLVIAFGTFGYFLYSWNYAYSKHSFQNEDGIYYGEFKGNMFHGQGTFTFDSGIVYEGTWEDGEMDGNGTLTFKNGSKFEGNFEDGVINGEGKITDGKKITYGTWKNGVKIK